MLFVVLLAQWLLISVTVQFFWYGLANGNKQANTRPSADTVFSYPSICCSIAQYSFNLDIRHFEAKTGVAATLPWKTFIPILGFYTLLPELGTRIECTHGCTGIELLLW